jgi:hypothetical protein
MGDATKTLETDSGTGEFEISDKMHRISDATNTDGSVDVDISSYEEVPPEEGVRVTFMTPTGEQKEEVMQFPKRDDQSYKFVRLCNNTVGSLNAAEYLNIDSPTARADPDSWELIATRSRRKMLTDKIASITPLNIVTAFMKIIGAGALLAPVAVSVWGVISVGLWIAGVSTGVGVGFGSWLLATVISAVIGGAFVEDEA